MSDSNTNNIGWFLAGLGLGVAGTILYAPKSGAATRKEMLAHLENGREYLVDLGQDAGEQVDKLVDRGRDEITRRKEQVTSAIDAGRKAVHDATK